MALAVRADDEQRNPISSGGLVNGDPCGSSKRRNLSFFPIDDLEDSLLVEILCRIRCSKSLVRCKCVSRRWFNLVSSPYFVKHRFLNHHGVGHPTKPSPSSTMQYNLSLVKMDPKECRFWFQESDLPPLSHNPLSLLATHNDLLLYAPKQQKNHFPDPSQFYICNPFTMDFIAVPPALELEAYHDYVGAGLLVKYHSSNKVEENRDAVMLENCNPPQFWVVRLRHRKRGKIGIDIYSSESGMWKESILSPLEFSIPQFSNAAAHNDKLYWVMVSYADKHHQTKIIAYDPNTMEFQYIHGPKFGGNSELFCKYIVGWCCGFLRLVATASYRDPKHSHLVIWELKDHESAEWSLMHKIYFSEMVCTSPELQKLARSTSAQWVGPLLMEENDGNIVYLKITRNVVSCDIKKKKLEVVCRDGYIRLRNVLSVVLQQQPTLLRDRVDFELSSQINN